MSQTATKKTMSLKPLGDRVIAQRMEAEETAKGGIILPDTAKKKPETARVMAIGPGRKNKAGEFVPVPVKEGDVILMDKYAGQEVTIEDEEYIIVRADDIIAIVE